MLYLSLCSSGPREFKRIGPFQGMELFEMGDVINVQDPGEQIWHEIAPWDDPQVQYVFVATEPSSTPPRKRHDGH